jgi:hypothetical protein
MFNGQVKFNDHDQCSAEEAALFNEEFLKWFEIAQ